ncbi:MAG: serine acetyltransferase [Bacteroidales bacterium]|jgi:serine O-acetyltransferase|nr:serine acetyltransferase [Bacteroidales bacterium]
MKPQLTQTINELSSPESYNRVYQEPNHGMPMPSTEAMKDVVTFLREIIFPGYFGVDNLNEKIIRYYTGMNVKKLFILLSEQIKRGFCFECKIPVLKKSHCVTCEYKAQQIAIAFIQELPEIRRILSTDIQAAYNGDPAAHSIGEVIFCYPTVKVLLNYRVAHALVKLGVPLLPRIIAELAHSETGIDIHPEALIGEYFCIDHGTGVVIGATSIIGNHVQIYQGVTLGAKNFPLDEQGNPIKGIARHPIVEDNVIIYANATILGRITIGKNAIIGGNMWITEDVAKGAKVYN